MGFESAVGDGVPIFNLFRYASPGNRVVRFQSINNTTTNYILSLMEEGEAQTVEDGIKRAQELGIAEADPSGDIDGYDAAVKNLVLARVCMGGGRNESNGLVFPSTIEEI